MLHSRIVIAVILSMAVIGVACGDSAGPGAPTATTSLKSATPDQTPSADIRMADWVNSAFPHRAWSPDIATGVTALDPDLNARLVEDRPCSSGSEYLSHGGGLICAGTYLVVDGDDDQPVDIRTASDLRRLFSPVDSPREAVVFVRLLRRELHVRAVSNEDDRFLIWATDPNTFGCGNHQPSAVVLDVSRSGVVTELAAEPELEPPDRIICVD